MTHAERKAALEAKFATAFLEKSRHETEARRLHDEMCRIQGQIALLSELPELPDSPPAAG